MSQKNSPKKKNRPSNELVMKRRKSLSEIIDELQKTGKPITRDGLIEQVKKLGYKNYNRNTLFDDRTFLNKGNTFIASLTESNYSQYMEDIFSQLTWVEEQAMQQYEKEWTNSKLVTKDDPEKGITTEKHTTDELAQPKAAFLNIIKDIQKIKYEFLTGNNIHFSAALLMKKFQQMQQELFELRKAKKAPLLNKPKKEELPDATSKQ